MQESGSAYLVLPDGDSEGTFALASGYMWKIGRSNANDVVIHDKRVSREHAIIQRDDAGEFYLIDMGSRNGSFVNERRVSTPAALKDGDRLSIGGLVYTFRWPGCPDPAAMSVMGESGVTEACFRQQLVSVLVVDIRDFTHLAQQIDQSVLSEAIGTWFRDASEIMQRHGTWALKYIGDAVMATWLHGEAGNAPRDLERILRALIEFHAATAKLEPAFRLPAPLRIGAGINTGFASVGNTGSSTFTDYTALGDAVNAAFRIEAATRTLDKDLLIGNRTFEELQAYPDAIRLFESHQVQLKGYDAPATVWSASIEGIGELLNGAPARN
ncbi:MAG: adenylate/guanylate cyclase domain-containing protein [Bryobacteraceae bacterium]|nr:adenylate/guanylate cyclase domain-containing protein [Bryobacteraceae bacterium]